MKITRSIPIYFLFIISIFSCQDDIGNYTYTDINEVQIAGIESEYTVELGDSLTITPSLSFLTNTDTSLFTFAWYYLGRRDAITRGGSLIQTGLTLNYKPELEAGAHRYYFAATEKSSGIIYVQQFELFLGSPGYEGFLLLSDINGQARLDIVSYFGGDFITYYDILSELESNFTPAGTPISVHYSFYSLRGRISLVTSEEGYSLNPNTYQINSGNLLDPFSIILPSSSPLGYTGLKAEMSYFNDIFYLHGDIYARTPPHVYRTAGPLNRTNNTRYNIAPFFALANSRFPVYTFMFNQDNKSMYRYQNTNPTEITPLGNSNRLRITGTRPDNTPYELDMQNYEPVFMDYTLYNGGFVYTVFRDETDGTYYLARLRTSGVLDFFGQIDGPDLENAEHFTISPDWGFLLYSANGNIYEYNTGTGETNLMISYPGEEISFLSYLKFNSTGRFTSTQFNNTQRYQQYDGHLIVCTYSENNPNTSGKMHRYETPPTNQPFVLLGSYDGFGKILSVAYNEK